MQIQNDVTLDRRHNSYVFFGTFTHRTNSPVTALKQ